MKSNLLIAALAVMLCTSARADRVEDELFARTLQMIKAAGQMCDGPSDKSNYCQAGRKRIDEARAAWQARTNELAARGKIPRIGMSASQVENETVLGSPNTINRTETASTVSEQWVYSSADSKATYLYFRNGKLTSIQDSR